MNISEYTISTFRHLDELLQREHPEKIDQAAQLADSILNPQTTNANDIWPAVWNKPLYAHCKVATGDRWVKELHPYMDQALETWGSGKGILDISKDPNIRGKSGFCMRGTKASAIRDASGVSVDRLYRIQGAAKAVRARAQKNKFPFFDLARNMDGQAIAQLKSEFGYGWGHITVMHMLTDMGLSIKPDIHVMRSSKRIRLVSGINDEKVPTLSMSIKILDACLALLEALGEEVTPAKLRELDLQLMAFSQKRLLDRVP